jgi:uncharacterized membrane protein YccC
VAGYKKKRARELKHDKFRDTTMSLFDRLGDRLEGRGRTILYGIVALIALAIIVGLLSTWRARKAGEAEQALGRAIEIASANVSATPAPGATGPNFASENERAQRAVEEFQKVADKYGDPYRARARYFIATNLLTLDRQKGISQLDELTKTAMRKSPRSPSSRSRRPKRPTPSMTKRRRFTATWRSRTARS